MIPPDVQGGARHLVPPAAQRLQGRPWRRHWTAAPVREQACIFVRSSTRACMGEWVTMSHKCVCAQVSRASLLCSTLFVPVWEGGIRLMWQNSTTTPPTRLNVNQLSAQKRPWLPPTLFPYIHTRWYLPRGRGLGCYPEALGLPSLALFVRKRGGQWATLPGAGRPPCMSRYTEVQASERFLDILVKGAVIHAAGCWTVSLLEQVHRGCRRWQDNLLSCWCLCCPGRVQF